LWREEMVKLARKLTSPGASGSPGRRFSGVMSPGADAFPAADEEAEEEAGAMAAVSIICGGRVSVLAGQSLRSKGLRSLEGTDVIRFTQNRDQILKKQSK
jgi:hypothetical protein